MEISNLGLIVSTSLVIIGWFINSHFTREHEKLKKQTEYRLKTFESFFSLVKSINSSSELNQELISKIGSIRINFELYGHQDELDLFENFLEALTNNDLNTGQKAMNDLNEKIRDRLRKELVLPSIKLKISEK